MCEFFSCISNGQGNIWYFNWELRKKCISRELDYSPDSHSSIADYFGFKGDKEDRMNKYEFNPLTRKFTIDQLNGKDDSEIVERKLRKLDFTTIVPSLRIKEIYHPFKQVPVAPEVTPEMIELLQRWASVRASVSDSVGVSVRDSVRDSVWASVGNSVWDSVWDLVWDSVGNSVWAYTASFFPEITEWKYVEKLGPNPWEPCSKLWEMGVVPSFDGKTWRLHAGEKAEVIYEWVPGQEK